MPSKNHCFGLFCIKNTNKGQNLITTTKKTFFRVAFLAFVCPVLSSVLCALVLSKSWGYMMEAVSTDPPRWNVKVLGRSGRQKHVDTCTVNVLPSVWITTEVQNMQRGVFGKLYFNCT